MAVAYGLSTIPKTSGAVSPLGIDSTVELRYAAQADAHAIANVLVQSWRVADRGLLYPTMFG